LKVAVTLFAAVMLTLHAPVPEQAPLQPVNTSPLPGVAVRLTTVPYENEAEQALGHAIPPGELVTVPLPLTVTVSVSGSAVNVAVALFALVINNAHVPVPEQDPVQPENLYPAFGDAVSVIVLP